MNASQMPPGVIEQHRIHNPIYVISLAEAQIRRQRFMERLRDTDVQVTFFDAYRGLSQSLIYDESSAKAAKGRPLTSAEIGCYSSHAAVWQKILDEGHSRAFVFEDDVVIDWKALPTIERIPDIWTGVRYLRLYAKRTHSVRAALRSTAGRAPSDLKSGVKVSHRCGRIFWGLSGAAAGRRTTKLGLWWRRSYRARAFRRSPAATT